MLSALQMFIIIIEQCLWIQKFIFALQFELLAIYFTNKEQKSLDHGIFNIFVTYASHVHDISDGDTHSPVSILNKQDQKKCCVS